MSVACYCPYIAYASYLRKAMDDNMDLVNGVVGVLVWVMIIFNLLSCVRGAQAADKQRAELEIAAAEAEAAAKAEAEAAAKAEAEAEATDDQCSLCDITDDENQGLLVEIEELEGRMDVLREENSLLKTEVDLLKNNSPRNVVGMKIVAGCRRDTLDGPTQPKSIENLVLQAVADGWVISGQLIPGNTSGFFYQNLVRYETLDADTPNPFMLDAAQVAEKIRALPKEWRTARSIQKEIDAQSPSKTPFAPLRTINSVLYKMLGRNEVRQDTITHGKPVWMMM